MEKAPANIPALPGVYLFKDAQGIVVYIGKAKSLKNRVRSYFNSHGTDWKPDLMLEHITDIDYIITSSETEALLLEAQLIQQHQPRFNQMLKDGQPFIYLMFSKETLPKLLIVRNKKAKGIYFGPFMQKKAARSVHAFLVKTFALSMCKMKIENGCLDYHLGNCSGNCRSDFNPNDYIFRFNLAMDALKNNHKEFTAKIKEKMQEYIHVHAYEKARTLHRYLENLDTIFATIQAKYSEHKYADEIYLATKQAPTQEAQALALELQTFLQLPVPARTIDCFDISHFQSRYIVGSCVRFTDGKPDKGNVRRFKIKTVDVQDDYAALQEIISRRYRDAAEVPDVVLIDGGKGQLSCAVAVLPSGVPCISLAKKEELLYSKQFPDGVHLNLHTDVGRLLIALRDYAHHFAISYHRLRRKKELAQLG